MPAGASPRSVTVAVVRGHLTQCAATVLALSLACGLQACTSEARPKPGQPDIGNTILPDPTTPPPGSCDPLDLQIPAPTVTVGGNSVDATFGVGTYQCGTITGDGYVVNNFNPVLLDVAKPSTITVKINSDATPRLVLGLGGEFTQSGTREWTSSQPITGCDRLTMTLKSPSGLSRATYGVDIRVGGEATDCPQRVIDPTDVGAIDTSPSVDIPDVSVVLPEPTDSTAKASTTTGGLARSDRKSRRPGQKRLCVRGRCTPRRSPARSWVFCSSSSAASSATNRLRLSRRTAGSVPAAIAARTAQPGSSSCLQFRKRQWSIRSKTSANARSMPLSLIHI